MKQPKRRPLLHHRRLTKQASIAGESPCFFLGWTKYFRLGLVVFEYKYRYAFFDKE